MKTSLGPILTGLAGLILLGTAHAADPAATTDEGIYAKSPLGAGILADLLREGDISPGDEYTLEVGGRFHRIHARFMAYNCVSCHVGVEFPKDAQFLRREEFPIAAYPGAVDRGICLGCHRGEGALATPFYSFPGN
jgi:hypothetical protein